MTHEHQAVQNSWTFYSMIVHFLLAGAGLFMVAAGLLYLEYQDLARADLGPGLRITNAGAIYEPETQLILAGALIAGLFSLLPLQAVRRLNRRQQNAIFVARLTALLLLAGIPIAGGLWWTMDQLPAARGDMSASQQLLDEASLAVYALVILLLAQSALAVWYQFWLSSAAARRILHSRPSSERIVWRRLRAVGVVVGILLLIGSGSALGIVTGWLYEMPVERPAPGEFLYATTFTAFNDEWDMYRGRDHAEVVDSSSLGVSGERMADESLSIEYGAGAPEGLVWSTLDRTFNDFDLRVTAHVISGPDEESMYGVMFRYKDRDNFYLFRISGDGYYSLLKLTDGVIEDLSVWNYSDVIRQGVAANDIRIVAAHESFRFFVNGQPVILCLKGENLYSQWVGPDTCAEGGDLTTVYRDPAFEQGEIALFAGSVYGTEVRVAFDDVLVVGPEPQVTE